MYIILYLLSIIYTTSLLKKVSRYNQGLRIIIKCLQNITIGESYCISRNGLHPHDTKCMSDEVYHDLQTI
jgi:hypothetical protein